MLANYVEVHILMVGFFFLLADEDVSCRLFSSFSSSSSHFMYSPFLSPSLLFMVVTQIRGHIMAGSPPLSPLRRLPFVGKAFLSRVDLSPFFPCRHASNCVYSRYALIPVNSFFILQVNSQSHHGGIRTHERSAVNPVWTAVPFGDKLLII